MPTFVRKCTKCGGRLSDDGCTQCQHVDRREIKPGPYLHEWREFMYQVYKDDERFGKRPLLAVEMESRLVGDDQPMQRAADREMRRAAAESGLYEHTMALKDVDSRISSLTKTTMSENEIKSLVVPLTALKKKIEAAITLIEGGFLLGGSDDR